jgi:type II secretory ATPase GspE/PulE/Tfp pilus assembly ATPase PilB-like protein
VERRWLDGLRQPIPTVAWHRQGCPNCDGTGYFQRIGIFEVVPVKERIYDLILAGKDEHHLREDFRRSGQKLLLQDGLEKAAAGITDLGELARIGAQSFLGEATI